jgi:ribosomal protein L7/L12
MPIELSVNDRRSRVASVAELRQELAPFASEQFREIWVSMDSGGPSLVALINTNIGWLMYLRHDDGDPGFSSRNPAYNESDAMQSGLAFDSLFRGKHVPVIEYQLSNGQVDEYPASWALPEPDIIPALEYFVQHEGRRAPFVHWHDNAVAEPSPEIAQPEEKGDFTVVLQAAGQMKLEVIREVRGITGFGLKEAKDLIEGAPKNVIEGVARNEAEKIKATLEEVGARVEIKCR